MVGKQALEDAHDRDARLAWLAEALHRQKRLPDVKTLLVKRHAQQTPRQMRTVLQLISEKYRIPLKTRKAMTPRG